MKGRKDSKGMRVVCGIEHGKGLTWLLTLSDNPFVVDCGGSVT
jgi:hypothetical protein